MIPPGCAPRWRWRKRRRDRRLDLGAWARKNLFATPLDAALTILAALALAWALPQILNWLFFSAVWSGADRTACLTTDQGGAAAGRLVGCVLALRKRQVRTVHVWPLSLGGTVACHPDGDHVCRAAGAAVDPARALQAAERNPVLRGLPVRRIFSAARRQFRAALCRDAAVGRPAGHAGALFCRHRRYRCRSASCWRSDDARRCRRSRCSRWSSSRRFAACRW